MAQDVQQLLPKGVLNGECPLWSQDLGRLFWIDVRGHALHLFDPTAKRDQEWDLPSWIGACYLATDGKLAVTLRDGLFLFDPNSGELHFVAGPPYDARRFTFNDGRCDRTGRLFAGPMTVPLAPGGQNPTAPETAPLWRYEGGGSWTAVTDPVRTSNGLAWSPDGKTMYHADTRQQTVWAYDYDPASGTNSRKRVFAKVEIPGASGPDGASVDRDGFYWVAVYGGGCLLRFDPEGKLERRIDLPCRYPTMPAFGGPGLEALFVTSANHSLSEAERETRPQDGNLFTFPAPVPGLPEASFRPG
jgi:sugar lactone lactonase YvrE